MTPVADDLLLVLGILNQRSIAYAVAERALREGYRLVITNVESQLERTKAAVETLPLHSGKVEGILPLDVNNTDDIVRVRTWIESKGLGRLRGVLHSVAYAPSGALGGNFLDTSYTEVSTAFQTSAFYLKELAVGMLPLMEGHPSSIVTLTFGSGVAWPGYDWMGVCKEALESIVRYLAYYLGPKMVRVNAVSAGPINSLAARGIPNFKHIAKPWKDAAPLGWDTGNASGIASAVLFLLSDYSQQMTGEILHVDGGAHAVSALTHLGLGFFCRGLPFFFQRVYN